MDRRADRRVKRPRAGDSAGHEHDQQAPDRYSRQSFLGPDAESVLAQAVIGIVGLGGGGTHVVQQLAHVGFQHYVLYDPDQIEATNLNRMVGATLADVRRHRSKVAIAHRVIQRVQPAAKITGIPSQWQDEPLPLRMCDIIIGCVDSVRTRRDLEAVTRRFLIPYLDIGLDVHVQPSASEPPRMAGQVALSMPSDRCLQCLGVIQERFLADESRRYGDAGSRPQVVWANGILAST